jgi:hypothetical protein
MTTKTNATLQEEDLERVTLVAKRRIESNLLSIGKINENLTTIRKVLDTNPVVKELSTKFNITGIKIDPTDLILSKKRNKLYITPERLWFNMYGIHFYIEFTIRYKKNNENHLEGCFIYGMSYYIEKDKVEDQPIVCFSIDNQNIIVADDDFEEESWTCDENDLIDLHIRTLDKIFEEALFVVNKDKF